MTCPGITLVSEEFPPFMFGGIGSVAFDLAINLSKRKIPTTVFCGRSKKVTIEKPNDFLEIVRLPYLDLPPRFLWFQVQNFLKILNGRRDIGVIHAVSPQVAFVCAWLKKNSRKPLVTTYHGVPFYELADFVNSPTRYWTIGDLGYNLLEFPLNDALIRHSLRHSERIVACSRALLEELSSFYGNVGLERSLVIHNGVNFEVIENIRESARVKKTPESLSIVFVGRLYYMKGVIYLIKALEHLLPDFPNLRLNMFGKGPMKDKIQRLVLTRGLQNNLFLHGHVDRAKLMKEIAEANIFVFPSLREANPVSVMEAMALGKPVIAFDLPFAREIIKAPYNGLLVRPKDSKDLALKISTLLADEKLRAKIGQNAYEYAKQHHNWETLVDRYIELYEKVADDRQLSDHNH